jgi:seryl-tRNA synthetase
MHDLKLIRDHPEAFDLALSRRGLAACAGALARLDAQHRAALTSAQEMLARRNAASREIGQAKSAKDDAPANTLRADALMAEVATLKSALAQAEEVERQTKLGLDRRLAELPNLPAADVPDGLDAGANRELRRWAAPKTFAFPAKSHDELGQALGLMDFAAAAKMSGARFVVLKGPLARLSRALGQFMLDMHTAEFGYCEVEAPILVRDEAMFGTGQLPKFADEQFRTTGDYWLIPTAEVSLTNLVREQILDESRLPLRFVALTPCFRQEAGAAGKDTRGMIRQHQFNKVELISITAPEQSEAEHERMTACAEAVLQKLMLPYRVMVLCAGDMGFSAQKTYDIEVWLPGQNAYREISSCSNCADFQARRMDTRGRAAGVKHTRFLHTLNGSGLAVGRTLIAVLENYQQADGAIVVPDALKPYMAGIDKIAVPA